MQINLTPVQSKLLSAIGYDHESQTLAIQFPGRGGAEGPTYHYSNVTAVQWVALEDAESKGKWFLANIKNKPEHPFVKVS